MSLEGPCGSGCSQTSNLTGPQLIIAGLFMIYVGGLRFEWPGRGGGTRDAGEIGVNLTEAYKEVALPGVDGILCLVVRW